jgi:hypothetical protein
MEPEVEESLERTLVTRIVALANRRRRDPSGSSEDYHCLRGVAHHRLALHEEALETFREAVDLQKKAPRSVPHDLAGARTKRFEVCHDSTPTGSPSRSVN